MRIPDEPAIAGLPSSPSAAFALGWRMAILDEREACAAFLERAKQDVPAKYQKLYDLEAGAMRRGLHRVKE